MKAGAIAGIIIGVILIVIAIIIIVIISIKKRGATTVVAPLSREWIKEQFDNPVIDTGYAVQELYGKNGLIMSDIDLALANQAPINWIMEIAKYNYKIQKEEEKLKSLNNKGELEFEEIPNEYCDKAYPIKIKTPNQFSSMEYLSSSPNLRRLLQATNGNGSYTREVRDKEGLDNAIKYYYTYKAFDPTKWSDPAGELYIPESSYKTLKQTILMLVDFYKSPYQTFDKYLSETLSLPEDEASDLANQIITLLRTNPLNNVDDAFIESWNNMNPETNDNRYIYRLPSLYAMEKSLISPF